MYKNSEKEQVKNYECVGGELIETPSGERYIVSFEVDGKIFFDNGLHALPKSDCLLIRKAPTSEYPEGEWIDGYGPKVFDDDLERLQDVLHQIEQWCRAYPIKMFPEPDFKAARKVLDSAGISLDQISGSNMRHVVEKIAEMIEQARKATQ